VDSESLEEQYEPDQDGEIDYFYQPPACKRAGFVKHLFLRSESCRE